MKSFLCRVMTLVFLLNCLTPTTGWGQTSRRTNTRKSSLDEQVSAQVKKAQQNNSPAAQFARADKEVRNAHNARFAQADSSVKETVLAKRLASLRDKNLVEQPSSLHVASQVPQELVPLENQVPAKNFLKKVTKNEITFEDLIDYADPMDPAPSANDLLTIAYAAEVINNTVSEAMQLDSSQYDVAAFQVQLVQMQARLLWRLALLGFEMPSYTANPTKDPVSGARIFLNEASSTRKTMAVASLRMALLKIHQFYQAKQLPDPADEYQKAMLAKQFPEQLRMLRKPLENNGLLARAAGTARDVHSQAAKVVKEHGNLAVFMDQFITEFKQIIDEEPEEGTAVYQHAQVQAEYATAYALEYDPSYLKKIVALVDKGPQETDFKQDYSPILNAIFVTVFENTRYSTMGEAKTKQVLNMLQEFSDPQKYSLPTRVFALEAASLLFRPFNQDSFNLKQNQPTFAFFAPMNFNKPDENLRRVFAARVAELYCPLISENLNSMHLGLKQLGREIGLSSDPMLNQTIMQTYGLSSNEMEALADKLAYMYDGFYDIHTQWIEDANVPASQKVHANYPRTSCNITLRGNLNTIKRGNEHTLAFLDFSINVLFWVYGGEVFAFLGTAFRLTRGAVAALPKARRAFTVAARGEKVAAFNAQLQDGARFANWVYKNKRQQGYLVEAVVQKTPAKVEKDVVLENGVARTIEREIPAVTEYKPISSTHQLEGKYSLWNPKRWLGMKPGDEVVGYRVTRMEPNLQTTVGEMRLGQPIDGLHNLQEVSQMMRQLQNVADGSRFWFEQQPYWRGMLNMNQAMQERWMLGGVESSFKNQVDLWVPLGEAAQKTGKISETTRWWNVTQWGAPKKWGELVGEKMWGKIGEGGTAANMPIYVAPKTPLQFTWRGAANQLAIRGEDGVANISEVLPGFYTSGADVASGNVYKQMFNAYMKPLNWKGTFAKTFLPDYVPTKTFWQSIKANPVLGAQLAPQLLWRNRFATTTAFFGAWMGADRLVYPFFKDWMIGQVTDDAKQEIAKYGDTFSPEQAKMDELLLQEMGVDLSDKRAMSAYNDVLAAQPDQPDGTLITAPIVGARRALGMSFIGDDVKEDYEHQALRTDLKRALLHRSYTQFKEGQKATAAWQEEQREAIEQDKQQVLEMYAQGFAALPQVKKDLQTVYDTYTKEFLAAQTQQEAEQASERFIQQTDLLVAQAAEWDSALKTAEDLISQVKEAYSNVPGLITPQVEKYIRQVLRTYAQERCAALQTNNPQAMDEANQKVQERLKEMWNTLNGSINPILVAPAPAAAEQKGYGPNFDPHAAEE